MVNQKLSAIVQELWNLNENKLTRNVDYALDLQKNIENEHDQDYDYDGAPKPLFKFLNLQNLLQRPTFKRFVPLLNNYEAETGYEEQVTDEEVREEIAFLDTCLQTNVLRATHQFLVQEGKVSSDVNEFKELLVLIWFDCYSRSANEACEDSSAFEHVFVGEKRGNKVLGFHNWLDYYFMEKQGLVDYKGFIKSKTVFNQRANTQDPGVVAIKFECDGIMKDLGGFLVGMSPEFELALYTIIFLCSGQKTQLRFANIEVTFDCFKMEREGRKVIATLYPSSVAFY